MIFRYLQNPLLALPFLLLCFAEQGMAETSAGKYNESLTLVRDSKPSAVIIASPDAQAAAQRLQEVLKQDTGVLISIIDANASSDGNSISRNSVPIYLCTQKSLSKFKELPLSKELKREIRSSALKADGFIIKTITSPDAGAKHEGIALIGADENGLRYAVGEFWNYHVALAKGQATVAAPIDLKMEPSFPRRIIWNWDFHTNWDDDLVRVHQTKVIDPGGKLEPYLEQPDGYEKQFHRVIDYMADHKMNALIIWGFVNDSHGGVESAQRLSHYAKTNSIRTLPGLGTVIYGGFYNSASDPKNPYSLVAWMNAHPEVPEMIDKNGKKLAGAPCPSSPELAKFLKDGSHWFFKTFPDIGGVNIEHGDFFACHCERCMAEKAKPENDPNFFWDMMHTQADLVRIAHKINPDLWLTFSPYEGYNKEMMANQPKFLKQYPPYAVVQWTYSSMAAAPENWPADLKPPKDAKHSIGLLHEGSYWFGPRQWWNSPGQTYALIHDIIQRACARAIDDGSEGLEIVGQIGPASPQNDLNYLAFEAFTWQAKLSMNDWIDRRLPAIYGDVKLARRFLELLSDPTTSAEALQKAGDEAKTVSEKLPDPRQARRWKNLSLEMARRIALIKAGAAKPWGPGPLEGIPDVVVPF